MEPGERLKKRKKGEVVKDRKLFRRCRKCDNCMRTECGVCKHCVDMPKFGGSYKLKKACIERECIVSIKSKQDPDLKKICLEEKRAVLNSSMAVQYANGKTVMYRSGETMHNGKLLIIDPNQKNKSALANGFLHSKPITLAKPTAFRTKPVTTLNQTQLVHPPTRLPRPEITTKVSEPVPEPRPVLGGAEPRSEDLNIDEFVSRYLEDYYNDKGLGEIVDLCMGEADLRFDEDTLKHSENEFKLKVDHLKPDLGLNEDDLKLETSLLGRPDPEGPLRVGSGEVIRLEDTEDLTRLCSGDVITLDSEDLMGLGEDDMTGIEDTEETRLDFTRIGSRLGGGDFTRLGSGDLLRLGSGEVLRLGSGEVLRLGEARELLECGQLSKGSCQHCSILSKCGNCVINTALREIGNIIDIY